MQQVSGGRRPEISLDISSYFDDSHLSDWRSAKVSGQFAYKVLNEFGHPFLRRVDYDLGAALREGTIEFFVRERLVKTAQDMVAAILRKQSLRASAASKLNGMLNFLELGMFGRVGAGGLQAIKDRQMQRGERLTPALEASLDVIQAVLATKPKRKFELWWSTCSRALAASDAAEDERVV